MNCFEIDILTTVGVMVEFGLPQGPLGLF